MIIVFLLVKLIFKINFYVILKRLIGYLLCVLKIRDINNICFCINWGVCIGICVEKKYC